MGRNSHIFVCHCHETVLPFEDAAIFFRSKQFMGACSLLSFICREINSVYLTRNCLASSLDNRERPICLIVDGFWTVLFVTGCVLCFVSFVIAGYLWMFVVLINSSSDILFVLIGLHCTLSVLTSSSLTSLCFSVHHLMLFCVIGSLVFFYSLDIL